MIVHVREIPPTRDERNAARKARRLRILNRGLAVAAVLAPITLALALWLATRNELGSAVTLLALDVPLWVAAYVRLTDAPAVEMPR